MDKAKIEKEKLLVELHDRLENELKEKNIKIEKEKKASVEKVVFNNDSVDMYWSDGLMTTGDEVFMDIYDEDRNFDICVLKKLIGENNYRKYRILCEKLKSEIN